MFAYARSAIDYWPGWMTADEYVERLRQDDEDNDIVAAARSYGALRDAAFELARKVGWEGDVREGPFIAGLPPQGPEPQGLVIIAWKQDNNGDTFIVSPIRLPWLEEGDYGTWAEG